MADRLIALAKSGGQGDSEPMDIAGHPDDPAIEELARSIYTMFPRCMRCGEPIPRYEDADVRILSHRVVHRLRCADEETAEERQLGADLSRGMPRDG